MQKLLSGSPKVLSPPRQTDAHSDFIAVRYFQPVSVTFGRMTSVVVISLFYLLLALDGVTIALFGLASLFGFVLKLAAWVLGIKA